MRIIGLVSLTLINIKKLLVLSFINNLKLNHYTTTLIVEATLVRKIQLLFIVLASTSTVAEVGLFFLSFFETWSCVGRRVILSYTVIQTNLNNLLGGEFFTLALVLKLSIFISMERVWRSLRWLEREAVEMLGVVFKHKIDSRSLFTQPLIHLNPLQKNFPTGGFYEIRVSPEDKLKFFRCLF